MSSRHIYFFEDKADIRGLRYIERKYNTGPVVISRLVGVSLPLGMEGFSAYTIDDRHINVGIGQGSLNSGLMRKIYRTGSPGEIKSAAEHMENAEKYALDVRHKIFDMILCCGLERVGVTSVFLPDQPEYPDFTGYDVIYKPIWELGLNDLTGFKDDTILITELKEYNREEI